MGMGTGIMGLGRAGQEEGKARDWKCKSPYKGSWEVLYLESTFKKMSKKR